MIKIKKPKYEHDNYCTCCRKPFEDAMEISFSHKDFNDSTNITLCGKCRSELAEELGKADAKAEAIPVDWIEAEIKRLRDMDNGFATLSAGQIEAMLNKWRKEQEGEEV